MSLTHHTGFRHTHLRLLFADDCDLAAPRGKHLQAVSQVPDLVLPQHQDHVLGPAADGVLGLVQGNLLYGAGGGCPVHLTLVEPLSGLVGGLLHREEVPYTLQKRMLHRVLVITK